ncbi:ATP-grasp domain-containing protein [uncultured Jatrophihabitans sp.]|uniref:ATP-grasp domain-containing protein n=1 Tax=uncultured Jatrophihabitans sp. TaxID=1610747 RepID=UPI0035CC1C27
MIRTLAHAPNSLTKEFDLAAAAESIGVEVVRIAADDDGWIDVPALARVAGAGVAYRCAGGPLARAIHAGAPVHLNGATAEWFTGLPHEVTGRNWALVDVVGARAMLTGTATFIKLAEAKFRALPARRYAAVDELESALALVHAPDAIALLATTDWLTIDSEYRVFTIGREVVAWSPYLVQDDPWTPLLRTHRASFHDEAATFISSVLAALPDAEVPPTAVLDVARLQDNRFIVLEVNHVWSSGLYGCDPDQVLRAVIRAANSEPSEHATRWRWQPDPAAATLHR